MLCCAINGEIRDFYCFCSSLIFVLFFFSLSLFFSVQIFIIKWWWVLGRVVRASGVKMGHLPRGLRQKWTFAVTEKELSSIRFYLYSEFCCSLTRKRARVSKARWWYRRLSPIMVLLLISLRFQLSLCAWSRRATAILFFRRDLCVSLSWLLWRCHVSDIAIITTQDREELKISLSSCARSVDDERKKIYFWLSRKNFVFRRRRHFASRRS